jgi:hypothetical protein
VTENNYVSESTPPFKWTFTGSYEELERAVLEHLDEFYKADEEGDRIQWPQLLAEMVRWEPPK